MINWIKYPRPGTIVLPGTWLCTVATRRTRADRRVAILTLDATLGWTLENGEPLEEGEQVIAVAHVPSAYQAGEVTA